MTYFDQFKGCMIVANCVGGWVLERWLGTIICCNFGIIIFPSVCLYIHRYVFLVHIHMYVLPVYIHKYVSLYTYKRPFVRGVKQSGWKTSRVCCSLSGYRNIAKVSAPLR